MMHKLIEQVNAKKDSVGGLGQVENGVVRAGNRLLMAFFLRL